MDSAHSQAEAAGYGNVTDYVCQLIRADRLRLAKDDLDREILKGLESGEPQVATPEQWEAFRDEIRRRHAVREG